LIKEGGEKGLLRPYPVELAEFAPPPPPPPGPAEAPPFLRPEQGHEFGQLIQELKAARVRTGENIQRLATVDPRPLVWLHFQLGELHLAQWVSLLALHDRIHLAQIRELKASPAFPAG
jgi:hypothetical protein